MSKKKTLKMDEDGLVVVAGVQLKTWAKVLGVADVKLLHCLILAAMDEDRMTLAEFALVCSREEGAADMSGPMALARLNQLLAMGVREDYPKAINALLYEVGTQNRAKWAEVPIRAAAVLMAERSQPGGIRKAEGHGEPKH